MTRVEEILDLFRARGGSQYGRECVTQLEHALQCADLAEREAAPAALITAALLHDVGHLLHDLPDDAADSGVDDRHELTADSYLRGALPESVTEPIRLHVAAKRYLCTVDPEYRDRLSEPSIVSLELQGGPMSGEEVARFDENPFSEEALRLRRWDDEGKVEGLPTPDIDHFARYLREVAIEG